jgi:hypothetical protein
MAKSYAQKNLHLIRQQQQSSGMVGSGLDL